MKSSIYVKTLFFVTRLLQQTEFCYLAVTRVCSDNASGYSSLSYPITSPPRCFRKFTIEMLLHFNEMICSLEIQHIRSKEISAHFLFHLFKNKVLQKIKWF